MTEEEDPLKRLEDDEAFKAQMSAAHENEMHKLWVHVQFDVPKREAEVVLTQWQELRNISMVPLKHLELWGFIQAAAAELADANNVVVEEDEDEEEDEEDD